MPPLDSVPNIHCTDVSKAFRQILSGQKVVEVAYDAFVDIYFLIQGQIYRLVEWSVTKFTYEFKFAALRLTQP